MNEDLDLCSTCKSGYLKTTGEVVVQGESAGDFSDLGSRRIFACDNCKQRQIRIGVHQYMAVGDNIKTRKKMT